MKILIIGGTRFFGKRLTKQLLEQNHQVTLLTRGQLADGFGNKVTRLKADRTQPAQLRAAIQCDYDLVFDNMCMNATEAQTACEVFKGRIGHYVMTSTLSVYDLKAAIKETDFDATTYQPQTPKHPGEEYKEGKRAAEHAFLNAPFSVSRMRIPIVLAEDDYTDRLKMHIVACQEQTPIYVPAPLARFSYVHAEDAAKALVWMGMRRLNDVYNISAASAWTIQGLIQRIEQATGKSFVYGNENDRPSPYGITSDYYSDVSKARAAGFEAQDLELWLPKLIKQLSL